MNWNQLRMKIMQQRPLHQILVLLVLVSSALRLSTACAQGQSDGALPSDLSTYMGGNQEDPIRDVVADTAGNIYLVGHTTSPDFPTTAGVFDPSFNGWQDVYVVKLSPDGLLLWSTLIGGPEFDYPYAVEVDSQGYVFVAGQAGNGYPTTPGALQETFGGDYKPGAYGPQDGFVTKLSPDGAQLVWSTYFGGSDSSFIRDIDVDSTGRVYLAQTDVTAAHPHVAAGTFQSQPQGGQDGVVAVLAADGSQVEWATYLGGSQDDMGGPSIRVGPDGSVYVLGMTNSPNIPTLDSAYDRTFNGVWDFHIAKFSPAGAFLFGTYLGGSESDDTETHNLAVDAQGNAVLAATTRSLDFPTTSEVVQPTYGGSGGAGTGANTNYPGDGIIAVLSGDGTTLLASTYLGGTLGEGIEGVAVDAAGNVAVGGATFSDDFPVTVDAAQAERAGNADMFAVRLAPDLSQLRYSTYLGGSSVDYGRTLAVDHKGNLLLAGQTESIDWPLANALWSVRSGAVDGAFARIPFSGPRTIYYLPLIF